MREKIKREMREVFQRWYPWKRNTVLRTCTEDWHTIRTFATIRTLRRPTFVSLISWKTGLTKEEKLKCCEFVLVLEANYLKVTWLESSVTAEEHRNIPRNVGQEVENEDRSLSFHSNIKCVRKIVQLRKSTRRWLICPFLFLQGLGKNKTKKQQPWIELHDQSLSFLS